MGYNSQVSFTVVGPREQVLTKLATYRMTVPDSEEAISECRFIDAPPNLIIRFYAGGTKWYEGYKDVQALTALFDMFEEPDNDANVFNAAFVRIGEDDTDIETRYVGDDGYDLERAVRNIDSAYEFGTGKKLSEV